MRSWLLLAYKVPRTPTANRVYVWRKLKRLGAILLHDAVWVLPETAMTKEQFQWLADEIKELGGQVTLWESRLLFADQDDLLAQRFNAAAEETYREILAGLKRKGANIAALARQYQQVQATDYFRCDLGQQVREALMLMKGRERTKP